MKRALLSLMAIILCLSFTQCKSKEDKANELIKDYMFKSLYDFESYQPIETKIDSAFHTIYNDSTVKYYAYSIVLSQKEGDKLADEFKSIESSIDIWCDGYTYYSSYSFKKCQECREQALENLRKRLFWWSTIESFRDSLLSVADTLQNRFIGWQVTHDFRCKTKGGNPEIGHYVFVMDKDLKKIISKKDMDDDDEKDIQDVIKESIETTEGERNEMRQTMQDLISKISEISE